MVLRHDRDHLARDGIADWDAWEIGVLDNVPNWASLTSRNCIDLR